MKSFEVQEGTIRGKRPNDEMIGGSGKSHNCDDTFNKESGMDFNFVIENLKLELRRLEEENHLLRIASNESSQLVGNLPLNKTCLESEGSKLESANQEHEDDGSVDHEVIKAQLRTAIDSYAQLQSETAALRKEKEDEVSRLLNQIVDLEEHLNKLEGEHTNVPEKSKNMESISKTVYDEKIQLKSQVDSVLEGRQKGEKDLVDMLEDCQEHVRDLEVEQHNLLSTADMSNAAVRQLEDQNSALPNVLEQQKKIAENNISDLASELQVTQVQLLELQMQLQGLREENTYVVMKASKLDQLVEELKSDKLRLSSELERLSREKERGDEEFKAELRACQEQLQILEVDKSTSTTLVDGLNSRVLELEEDNKHLMGMSNEASQSVRDLWEQHTRLIEGYNKLEQDKLAIESERMELVAGIQTVWEQLHAAHEREALLTSDLRGLGERRDAEAAIFDQTVRSLEQQLEVLEKEKADLCSKSVETFQILEAFRQETSQKVNDLQEEKAKLMQDVAELEKLNEETEQEISMKQSAWEAQVGVLESEKSEAVSKSEDLEQRLQVFREEIKNLMEKEEKSNQLIQELRKEILRLRSEIDKLEEVKERQEGERLELAAELQAAWDQIQAVRDSEATLTTELRDLKDQRNEERLITDGLVQELRRQLLELEEKKSEAATKVEELSKQLKELRKEQELQDENERLTAEIAMLEQEKDKILTEKTVLLEEKQTLVHRVNNLEFDKSKMASEIEELNQWLQGPAAEKKQLAKNLDEMTQLLKGLELEKTQLQEEKDEVQEDARKLRDVINDLEEERAKSLLLHDELTQQLESLEEEKRQSESTQKKSNVLIQSLNGEIEVLREENLRMKSVHDDLLLRIQSLENEKVDLERMFEVQNAELSLKNLEHVDDIHKLEKGLEQSQMKVELLESRVFGLEGDSFNMKVSQELLLSQLQVLQIKDSELRDTIRTLEEELLKRHEKIEIMSCRLSDLEKEKDSFLFERKDLLDRFKLLEQEKIDVLKSLDVSNSSLEKLQAENLEQLNRANSLEAEMLVKQVEVERLEEQRQGLSTVYQDALLQLHASVEKRDELFKALADSNSLVLKLQAENAVHIGKIVSLEEELDRLQAKFQGVEDKLESLSSAHRDVLHQLQVIEDEKVELVESLDASNSSVQELQEKNVEQSDRVRLLEEEVACEQAELRKLEEQARSLSSALQDSFRQLQDLEGEKFELTNSLDSLNSLVQELQTKNTEHVDAGKILENEVQRWQAVVHGLEALQENHSIAWQDSLLQLQALKEEKDELVNSLDSFNLLMQKLQAENQEHSSKAALQEEEMERQQAEVHRLSEENESLFTANQETLRQLKAVESKKDELVTCVDAFNLSFQELHTKNAQHADTVKALQEEVARGQAEVERLEHKTPSLSVAQRETLLQMQVQKLEVENAEYACKILSLEEEVKILQAKVQGLEDKLASLSSVHLDILHQLQVIEDEKVELVESLDASNSSVQEFQEKNVERSDRVKLLEEEVACGEAELRKLEEKMESLCTAHEGSLLQLQNLAEKRDESINAFDRLLRNLQDDNLEHITKATSLEGEVQRLQAEAQGVEEKMASLSIGHQESLRRVQTLEGEKAELVNSVDLSSLRIQEFQAKSAKYADTVKKLEEEVQELKVQIRNVSIGHEESLSQAERFELQNLTMSNQLKECQDLIQRLHNENSQLASAARNLEEELDRRRDKIESRDLPIHNLDDRDFGGAFEDHGKLSQVKSLEDEKAESAFSFKYLEAENLKLSKLELIIHENQSLREQVQRLEVERENFEKESVVKFSSLEAEKSQLLKALAQSNFVVGDLHAEIDSYKDCVYDMGRDKDELVNQLSRLQEENGDIFSERDRLLSEMQDLREQLHEYVKRLQESDNDAKKYKMEALELAMQLEAFKEQVVKLVEANTKQARQLEMSTQLACLSKRNDDLVKDLEPGLDRQSLSFGLPKRNDDLVKNLEPGLDRQVLPFGNVEISHLTFASIDPMEELQQAILGWVEIITAVCQELAKLLRSVGEEKEKLSRKQGMSNQKADILTSLCQELDELILSVREKTERFAEELSSLKHKLVKSSNERDPLENDGGDNIYNFQQLPLGVEVANRETMYEVEASCQKLLLCQEGKTELEAHVANLSSCLGDSQGQLKALVVKSSVGNPYLLTSRVDGGDRQGLACFSADGNCVMNYGRDLKVRRDIKALEQEKKEKKENGTLPALSQRNQTPARNFKKCKVTMPQPKRRWIF
ncbi:uncharacterized protein [Physcomitrium patens]|uniref:Uncharacterized protein n=2 Tax=Physcomitrium patens TaxID=3218 RepID=A0A2K1KKD4_PHYPA|nr:golgin subfamily B member 1-like isoform X1 [Physcomitrium patens]XP_024376263.1 golgin subfamily B member 1-like isoform X1 [Physcomitrium patens]PNR54223.1 hypothetical protein PHYPA_007900 [Physcomitrium patens]|eukprot:XP_024376262.1 golgin subfamily B member 1-like isoform X1 [Physcomitrella patens]